MEAAMRYAPAVVSDPRGHSPRSAIARREHRAAWWQKAAPRLRARHSYGQQSRARGDELGGVAGLGQNILRVEIDDAAKPRDEMRTLERHPIEGEIGKPREHLRLG